MVRGMGHRRLEKSGGGSGDDGDEKVLSRKERMQKRWRSFTRLLPFVWPKGRPALQLAVLFNFVLLILTRVLSVMTPLMYRSVVDALSNVTDVFENGQEAEAGSAVFLEPIPFILAYFFVDLSAKLSKDFRTLVWVKVEQNSERMVKEYTFRHLHQQSLRFHLHRKTGEVLRVMDRGTSSIASLLRFLFFNVAPTIIEILTVGGVFFALGAPAIAVTVTATMGLYILFTILITQWRTKFRRQYIEADNAQESMSVDSLLNFETVKYFAAEDFEVRRFNSFLDTYFKAEVHSQVSLALLNMGQNILIGAGSVVCMLLMAVKILEGRASVGDFVMTVEYIRQLYSPLSWLGSSYRVIQQAFIDMEKLTALWDQEPEIQDGEGATDITVDRATIEFKGIHFYYAPDIPGLKNVNFFVDEGKTLAIVGPTGAGKSTIGRLLFRFYDPQEGEVLLGGNNIADFKQRSVRMMIGVVPQDTVLFNDTIEVNIGYGKEGSVTDEIIEAARTAHIHDFIEGLPQKYQTKVGERGLRLSGGEKQRVAIARMVLKNPRFVLLDEATSALDTAMERNIQASLAQVCSGRTTIVVAHRLSTVVDADEIIVLEKGEILERGTHASLMSYNGKYASMWTAQAEPLPSPMSSQVEGDVAGPASL